METLFSENFPPQRIENDARASFMEEEANSEPFLTDTHAHLASSRFAGRVGEVLAAAREAGVGRIVTISCDEEDARDNLALASAHPGVCATVGVHPSYVHEVGDGDWLGRIAALARSPGVVAIGEIGLDFYHPPGDGSDTDAWRARQRSVFEAMLQLAAELGLPVVVHQRESGPAVLEVLAGFPGVTAVLHCFTGGPQEAERALELGHFLSFTGVLTYPKAEEVRATAAMAPLDRIMLETDAPYLAPVPFRGKPCEPAMVRHTADRLAEIRGLTPQEIASATSANAEGFFRLPPGRL
jgi:TatD DNase family protein